MHPDKIRDLILQQAEENLLSARENVKKVAEIVQAQCPHTLVYQAENWHSSNPRICPKCGLEVDSHSTCLGPRTWTPKGFAPTPLNNHEDRIVVEVDREEFLKVRVAR